MQISTIGIDIAKNVFQVHGVDAQGKVVLVRQLRRSQVIAFLAKLAPCLVGMEACATSHYWARELAKLGHDVRLIPPAYVKGYVKRQKNDAADAAAICEAVGRPSMRFVPIKSPEQQSTLAVHRTRNRLVSQRTQLINALRAHLAELGLVAEQGRDGLARLIEMLKDEATLKSLPAPMLEALRAMIAQLAALQIQIGALDQAIQAQHRASDVSRRLETIPSIGRIGATALTATITDPSAFWTSPDLVESDLLFPVPGPVLRLEGCWADVAEARVPSARVIEAFDILANGLGGLLACREGSPPDQLGLHGLEHGLDHGVVKAVAAPAHRRDETVVAHEASIIV